jgi:phage shock protein A
MRFLDRLTLLIRADAHGVLEQLEERSLLAKQHLREAELELTRKRARAEALEEESRRLREEAERLDREIASLDEDVELALEGGKDELARFSVRRLLPKRRAVAELRERAVEIDEQRRQLVTRLESQEVELEELRGRVRVRLAAERADETGRLREAELPAADEEVELELLRRRAVPAAGDAR